MTNKSIRMTGVVLAVAVAVVWQADATAQVASLTGENFISTSITITAASTPNGCQTPTQVQASGFFNFSVDGVALGPYPGTFHEEGSVSFSPGFPPSYFAFFTISSGAISITGTKSGDLQQASCFQATPVAPVQGDFAGANLVYSANNAAGTWQDSGLSSLQGAFGVENFFTEQFTSTTAGLPGTPLVLTLSPASAVNPVGTTHTVTATVIDAFRQPVVGATVQFTVTGSVSASGSCQTNANGQCSFTYQGPPLPGADIITATSGVATGTASKSWAFPACNREEKATGGGQTMDFMSFGFNVENRLGVLSGHCNVIDHQNNHLKCLDVQTLIATPGHVTFMGNGTMNGRPTRYQADADDPDEPQCDGSMGGDSFRIITTDGFHGGGILVHGHEEIND